MPDLITFVPELGADDTFPVDQEGHRVGHAGCPTFGVDIQNLVILYGGTCRISEQIKCDAALLREAVEHFDRIIADADQLKPGRLDLPITGLQLDQLLLAIGSPVSRPEEHQRHRTLLKQVGQLHDLP